MMMFRCSKALAAVSMLALLSGCATGGKGLGLTGGGAQPRSDLLAALGDGLLGDSAAKLSAGDRKKALEAEYRALEYSPAGKSVSWRGAVASGDVTAAPPYQVGSQNCRQYTHTFTISGAPQTERGSACRNPDGSWTPLN